MAITKIQSESLNLSDTYAFTGTVTGAGGVNTPAFEAYASSAQTVSSETLTKAQPNTELFDTNSCYDNSTYKFIPTVAGKYLIWGVIAGYADANTYDTRNVKSLIYKNGSVVRNVTHDIRSYGGRYVMPHVQTIQEANGTTDYFELYGFVQAASGTASFQASTSNLDGTRFGAYKIIE